MFLVSKVDDEEGVQPQWPRSLLIPLRYGGFLEFLVLYGLNKESSRAQWQKEVGVIDREDAFQAV